MFNLKNNKAKIMGAAFAVVASLCAGANTFAISPDGIVYGDVTGDQKVTNVDLIKIIRHNRGLSHLTAKEQKAADVNLDGKVNKTDENIVSKYLVGTNGYEVLPHIMYGDINGDNVVNNADLVTLYRYMTGIIDFEGTEAIAADVDVDGDIDNTDIFVLAKHLAEQEQYKTLPYLGVSHKVGFTFESTTTSNVTIRWSATPKAEGYKVVITKADGSVYYQNSNWQYLGMHWKRFAAGKYTFSIQAYNTVHGVKNYGPVSTATFTVK